LAARVNNVVDAAPLAELVAAPSTTKMAPFLHGLPQLAPLALGRMLAPGRMLAYSRYKSKKKTLSRF
jgi:hypothetical protein